MRFLTDDIFVSLAACHVHRPGEGNTGQKLSFSPLKKKNPFFRIENTIRVVFIPLLNFYPRTPSVVKSQ